MTDEEVYISHSRADRDVAAGLERAIAAAGLTVWYDGMLMPGQSWEASIRDVLETARIVVVLFTARSIDSEWVMGEASVGYKRGVLFPVAVGEVELPFPYTALHVERLPQHPQPGDYARVAAAVAAWQGTPAYKPPAPSMMADVATAVASAVAGHVMTLTARPEPEGAPDSIFLVHGHDEAARQEVADFLLEIGVKPVILKDVAGTHPSLYQRFEQVSREARFAVVLITPDDLGAARLVYDEEGAGVHALKFRARQNVLLELGFFYGYLGWQKVFTLTKKAKRHYPEFEMPSDIAGMMFEDIGDDGRWRTELIARLRDAGFKLKV